MAKKNSDRIRLPELPIFKKYSLALRQEFASPKELLAALDRTARKVETLLDKAESERLVVEEVPNVEVASLPELGPGETGVVSPALLRFEEPGEEPSQNLDALQEVEPSRLEATTELQFEEPEPPKESGPEAVPEESEFGLLEELAEDGDADSDFEDRPLWEPEPSLRPTRISRNVRKAPSPAIRKSSGPRTSAGSRSLAGKKNSAKARTAKSNKKRRSMRPEIVRVSSRGTPLKAQAAKRATGRKRGR